MHLTNAKITAAENWLPEPNNSKIFVLIDFLQNLDKQTY